MRRIFFGLTLSLCLLGLCSCASWEPPDIKAAVDEDVTIHCGETAYEGRLTYVDEQTAALTISSPETIRGLTFRRSSGQMTLSLGSLQCRSDPSLLPGESAAKETFSLFDALLDDSLQFTERTADGDCCFAGSSSSGELSVRTDESGYPELISRGEWRVEMLKDE